MPGSLKYKIPFLPLLSQQSIPLMYSRENKNLSTTPDTDSTTTNHTSQQMIGKCIIISIEKTQSTAKARWLSDTNI